MSEEKQEYEDGKIRVSLERCDRQECQVCGEPATRRVSYLLERARSNPDSSAYCKDDCSWCSDADAYACEKHTREVERDAPEGMEWCSTFDGAKMPHMLYKWCKVRDEKTLAKAEIAVNSHDQLVDALEKNIATFCDFQAGLELLRHNILAKACNVAATATQSILKDAGEKRV